MYIYMAFLMFQFIADLSQDKICQPEDRHDAGIQWTTSISNAASNAHIGLLSEATCLGFAHRYKFHEV